MPLIEVARAATKAEAMEGLQRWQAAIPRPRPAWSPPTSWWTRCAGGSRPGPGSGLTCASPGGAAPAQEPLEVDYDPWAGTS